MKIKLQILFLGVAILLSSCAARKAVTPVEQPTPLQVDTTRIPLFSPEVLYVIAREYELRSDTAEETLADYADDRLMQLYPHEAYRGVSAKLFGPFVVENRPFNRQISMGMEYNFVAENDTLHPFISQTDEAEFMALSADEKAHFDFLNALAHGTAPITLEQLAVADSIGRDSLGVLPGASWLDNENSFLAGLLPNGAFLFYRTLQSKSRAELLAQRYYGEKTKNGHRGDAFKHLLVNVLLHRYLGEAAATLIMDVYWEGQGTNAPCDKYMDLHNNYVGRHARYHAFVDGGTDWESWARRVLVFIEDETNAVYQDWNKSMTIMQIRQSEQNTDKTKYIYWNKGDKTND